VSLEATSTPLPGLLLLKPTVFEDSRGYFLELANAGRLEEHGLTAPFVQTNVSCSRRDVIRGLHYQFPSWQGKLVSVLRGEVFDVAVDLRWGLPTFGRWFGARLSEDNHLQMYVPEGFAHGFATLSDDAVVHYQCTRAYVPAEDLTLRYDDPDVGIEWGVADPVLSSKDAAGTRLADAIHLRERRWSSGPAALG
jgi:dTDP-4-dehydrorhamnose 3,5-epimerase